jgi:hypothetical protein
MSPVGTYVPKSQGILKMPRRSRAVLSDNLAHKRTCLSSA